MGRKGNWFSAVKKALSPDPKEKKDQKANKSKKRWLGKQKNQDSGSYSLEETLSAPPPSAPVEEVDSSEVENGRVKQVNSAVAAETTAQAAVEVVPLKTVPQYAGKSKEEVSAIKIQTAFRGYLARKALRALRGLVRLKSLVQGNSVKRQITTTLRSMQTLTRVQSQVHSRRLRLSEENQALQRQLLLKRAKELENLRASMGDDWDDSLQSKEQLEANLLSKHEAAIRRERALAYAFSHQTPKNSSRTTQPLFMDLNNPNWGWSWLERWSSARAWDSRCVPDKQKSTKNDQSSLKSSSRSITGQEIGKAYARYQLNKSSPPATLRSPDSSASVAGKFNPMTQKGIMSPSNDESKSNQSDLNRRHSIGESPSVRDDESMASSPSVRSYMAPTESARAKARLQSPLGLERYGSAEKGPVGSVKKRLSFPSSPARPRRHSGPPKVESLSNGVVKVSSDQRQAAN